MANWALLEVNLQRRLRRGEPCAPSARSSYEAPLRYTIRRREFAPCHIPPRVRGRVPSRLMKRGASLLLGGWVIALWSLMLPAGERSVAAARQAASPAATQPSPQGSPQRLLLNRYCVSCHNQRTRTAGLALDTLDLANVAHDAATWEKVVRKLRAGVMPPANLPRPDEGASDAFAAWLETELDRAAAAVPNPGRTETFHRLNRAEYHNAVRDVLAIDLDVADLLPADDSSYGFDNIAGVLRISPALMERYLAAAKTISRLAVGTAPAAVDSDVYRVAPDAQQHDRADGLQFGTRGGTLVRHLFPVDAEYEIRVEVTGGGRGRDVHQLEVTIEGERVKVFTLEPGRGRGEMAYGDAANKLEVRVPVKAGPHDIGVAFLRKPPVLVEQLREPFQNPRISGNDGGPGGALPWVASVTVVGPYQSQGPGDTPSRRRIFVCRPAAADERRCARPIVTAAARRAYRGTVTDDAVAELLAFYDSGRAERGTFDAGIELAIRRLLVSPEFLFRLETDPTSTSGKTAVGITGAYRVSDLELASRLSFFLWSSVPDDELLTLAVQGKLTDEAVLERQARRMLADPRSESLTKNFAGQWLQLRNMANVRPGDPYSLTFDESLRQAMWSETELFFASILREDRGVLDMLTADYTFLNERLAQHYNIPNVQGSHFRRVTLPPDSPRRGLLGQA